MHNKTIRKIIKSTLVGYNKIANKFHHTRISFFGDLKFVKNYSSSNSKVLDFGCGNGRLVKLLKGEYESYLGLDTSANLIKIAKESRENNITKFQIIRPFQKISQLYNSFDVIYTIAVFHHFPGKKYRLERARELRKILKDNGTIVVSVWNLWQKKYYKNIIKEFLKKMFRFSELEWGDLIVPFKTEAFTFNRYHHAFTQKELRRLFEKAGFKTIETKNTGKNIVYIGRKFEI